MSAVTYSYLYMRNIHKELKPSDVTTLPDSPPNSPPEPDSESTIIENQNYGFGIRIGEFAPEPGSEMERTLIEFLEGKSASCVKFLVIFK